MTKPILFNPSTHVIGLSRDLAASIMPERPDPPIPFVGVTMGVATMDADTVDSAALIKRSDERLYEAKNAGRNCVRG